MKDLRNQISVDIWVESDIKAIFIRPPCFSTVTLAGFQVRYTQVCAYLPRHESPQHSNSGSTIQTCKCYLRFPVEILKRVKNFLS